MKITIDKAIRNAKASLQMEGMNPTEKVLADCQKVLEGKMSHEQYIESLREKYMEAQQWQYIAQRLFLAQLARNVGYDLDFADIDVDELMIATIQSAGGVIDGLKRIFDEAIKQADYHKKETANAVSFLCAIMGVKIKRK